MPKKELDTPARTRKPRHKRPRKAKNAPKRSNQQQAYQDENCKWLNELPMELRGPPQNRFGGYKTLRIKALKGSTFGAASPGRRYSRAERLKLEQDLRERSLL